MIKRIFILTAISVFSFAFTTTDHLKLSSNISPEVTGSIEVPEADNSAEEIVELYNDFAANNASVPAMDVFENAITGYSKLEEQGRVDNQILTVVDFGLSSKKKRMWIMDMENKEVLFHTYVAHGQNTGNEYATKFSNIENSLQSSLGFYLTAETYYGKNGLSLFIDGQEKEFNSNARKRYVVIHGADYAEPSFITKLGRLGRSYGCPAVPNTIAKEVIGAIKGESVVYIHQDDKNYLQRSTLLN